MPITIPIEIGDVIRVGKFKNKRVTVKEIGTDLMGLPTVNGKGIMKIRIEKLMPPKEPKQENNMNKPNKAKLDRMISTMIKEAKLHTGYDYEALWEKLTDSQRHSILNKTFGTGYEVRIQTAQSLKTASIPLAGNVSNPYLEKIHTILDGMKQMKQIKESLHSNDTQVKIKQKDKLWWICQEETDDCLNSVGFDSKEAAEHSALTKGYSFSGQEEMNEMEPEILTTKKEKVKGVDKVEDMKLDKEKEIKLEILRIAKRVIKEETSKRYDTFKNGELIEFRKKTDNGLIATVKSNNGRIPDSGNLKMASGIVKQYRDKIQLHDLIQQNVSESFSKKKVKLTELEITDDDLIKEAEEYAKMSDEIERMEEQLKLMKDKFKKLDEKFSTMMAALEKELGSSKETFIRAKNILITIKRKGGDRTSYKYKEAFEWLYERVNPQMKKLIDETMEAHKTVTYIKSSLSVQQEASNWLSNLYSKVKNWFVSIVKNMRATNNEANSSLDKLESMI